MSETAVRPSLSVTARRASNGRSRYGRRDAAGHRPVPGGLRRAAGRAPARGRAAADGQGRRMRGRARRRRRLQAAQLDERAQRAAGAARALGDHQPQGRAADHRAARGAERHRVGDGCRSWPPEGRRGGAPAGAPGRHAARPRRRAHARAPGVPDRPRPRRPPVPGRGRRDRGHRGEAPRRDRRRRATARDTSSGSPWTRRCGTIRGMFVAQVVKPQARVLAEARGLRGASRSTTTSCAA